MKVITYNINGTGYFEDKKKAKVKELRRNHQPDLFFIQEAVMQQGAWLAPRCDFAKRIRADSKEGGYVIAYGTTINNCTIAFEPELSSKDFPRLRPPVRVECSWSQIPVRAFTWHAPAARFASGGSRQADVALQNFIKLEANEILKATQGALIWLLAGDLNVKSDIFRKALKNSLPKQLYQLARVATSTRFDHAVMFYGDRPRIQPTKARVSGGSFSDHDWLIVRFPTNRMV